MSQDDKNKNPHSSVENTVLNPENDNKTNMIIPNTETTNNVSPNGHVWASTPNSHENIRENMVSKATEFLLAGRHIQNTPIERKVFFLRSKGLTDQEIQLSLQRASVICSQNQNSFSAGPPTPIYQSSDIVQLPIHSQNWFRKLIGPIAFTAMSVYLGYQIYKKYIEKWLFGRQKSSLERCLESVEISLRRCITLLEERNSTEFSNGLIDRQRELEQIRADLKSVKSLLLNRNQFPPAPVTSSIPHWQLSRAAKLETDQQMGVNGTDTLNSSLPNIGVNAAFKIAANGAMPPISFEQNISDDLAVDKNGQSDHGNHM